MEIKTLQALFGGTKRQCRRLRRLLTGYREDILRTTDNSRFSKYTHPCPALLVCHERWDSILNLIMQMGNVPIVQDPESLDEFGFRKDGAIDEGLPFEIVYFCDSLTRLTWTLRWEFRNKEGRKVQIQHWSELHQAMPWCDSLGSYVVDPETAGFYVAGQGGASCTVVLRNDRPRKCVKSSYGISEFSSWVNAHDSPKPEYTGGPGGPF